MATVDALKNKKDIELMKAVLKERNLRYYLLFVVGVNTGLRIGDLLRLKLSDFVNEKGGIRKHLIVTEEKTGKKRQIAINGTIQKALKSFMSCCSPCSDDYLFTSRKGLNKPVSTTQAYRVLNDVARDCRIDINVGTHTLRKTWSYWVYVSTGNNIALLMDLLGHSSQSVTLRYIGLTQELRDNTYLGIEV